VRPNCQQRPSSFHDLMAQCYTNPVKGFKLIAIAHDYLLLRL
jgi:hypothetical protein